MTNHSVRLVRVGSVYRHYKTGGLYRVTGLAKDVNADDFIVSYDDHGDTRMSERWVVVYEAVNPGPDTPSAFVRTYEEFFEQFPNGTHRFTRVESPP